MIFVRTIHGAVKFFKYNLGKSLCEWGLGFDRVGSRLTEDISYLQKLSRHRTYLSVYDVKPTIDNAFVAPSSSLSKYYN
jgi:hypothetical protein